ncbi:MAG: DUF4290 domain-containing protein [Flavobacteriales bacterium]|nr:DUF4290 domain-containing protein [Flavobacteriales bacterium]MCB9165952.1 DUF4290 domain-containing protein [Flavobacteriales bacterium]
MEMDTAFDYNTQRPRLIIPEYGRHVQRMVEHCMGIEDRVERTRTAKAIIQVIGRLNPALRNSEDGDHMLWDHLYIMSDFKLDVDAPFPMPTPEELDTSPEKVPYPRNKVQYGHYGNIVERMIDKCAPMQEGPEREAFTLLIANLMKRQFLAWNRDSVGDGVIIKDLAELSKGRLKLPADQELTATNELLRQQQSGPRNDADPRKRSGRSRNRKRKKRY